MRMDREARCVHGLPQATCFFCQASYWPWMLILAGVMITLWFARGPEYPAVPLLVTLWTWMLGPGMALPLLRRLPRGWFYVPARERVLHRLLGVGLFGW